MTRANENGIAEILRDLAATRPNGFRSSAVTCFGARAVWNGLQRAVKSGLLHRARVSHRVVLYFGDARAAMRCEASHMKVTVMHKPRSRAPWPAETPINYPKNPDGSPAYKRTIAPTPPAPTHTNTFSR